MADLDFSDLTSNPLDFSDLTKKKSITDYDKEGDFTEGMSNWDLFKRGAGAAVGNLYLGAKQRFGVGDQEALQDLVDVAKSREKKITAHPSGFAGALTGDTLATAPAMLIPGANGIIGGALTGGALGYLSPTSGDESAATNAAFGATLGVAAPYAARAGKGLYDAAVRPFSDKGREAMIGELLRDASGKYVDDVLNSTKNPEIFVPGSNPTLAEVTGNRGIAQVQKAARNMPGEVSTDLVNREMDNVLARRKGLLDIAKTDADIEKAKEARGLLADPFYESAGKAQIPADDTLNELLSRPSLQDAIKRATSLAKERGESFVMGSNKPSQTVPTGLLDGSGAPFMREEPAQFAIHSGKGLQYLKMALDDMIKEGEQNGIGSHQKQALTQTKNDLMQWLEETNPDYIKANRVYAQMSRPIDQMKIAGRLADSLTPPLARGSSMARETGNSYANALDNESRLIKQETGMKDRTLEQVMTPRQRKVLDNTLKDIQRNAFADDLMKAKGSDTAQNILADNFTRKGLGIVGMSDGPAKWLAQTSVGSFVPRLAGRAIGKQLETKLQGVLADALLDPKYAGLLMEQAVPRGTSRIPYIMNSAFPATGLLMSE